MTEFKHTPEPWKIDEADDMPLAVIADDDTGEGIVEMAGDEATFWGDDAHKEFNERSKADFERIVACVNGCKGIQDPETTVPELVVEATRALEFITRLMSLEPNDAVDLLANFGDDVEDRLIAVLAKTKEEIK